MILTDIDIHELIPQQEPFVMVGSLIGCNPEQTATRTLVTAENLFVRNGLLLPEGVIENIAQTAAAGLGFLNKYQLNQEVKIGFIGAIRNLCILRQPAVGETLTTTVRTVEKVFGMSLVEAEVKIDSDLVARGSMKIALIDQ